jgi:hypothetical protein
MIVYVWSPLLSAIERLGHPFARHAGVPAAEVAHVLIPPGGDHPVHTVVEWIKAAAGSEGSIHLLVFNSHGRVGEVAAADGRPVMATGLAMESRGVWTADVLGSFAGLDGWFSPRNQGIELQACNIARGFEGRRFCQAMADLTGARV